MTKGRNIHVVSQRSAPLAKRWAVEPEKGRPTSEHRTQQAAITKGRAAAKKNESELLIHNRKGEIRDKNTYGKDPYPPKG